MTIEQLFRPLFENLLPNVPGIVWLVIQFLGICIVLIALFVNKRSIQGFICTAISVAAAIASYSFSMESIERAKSFVERNGGREPYDYAIEKLGAIPLFQTYFTLLSASVFASIALIVSLLIMTFLYFVLSLYKEETQLSSPNRDFMWKSLILAVFTGFSMFYLYSLKV